MNLKIEENPDENSVNYVIAKRLKRINLFGDKITTRRIIIWANKGETKKKELKKNLIKQKLFRIAIKSN